MASQKADRDNSWREMQDRVQLVSGVLLGLDPEELGAFIRRGEESQAIAPILHPSEFRVGADKLREVLAHARALNTARATIVRTMIETDPAKVGT